MNRENKIVRVIKGRRPNIVVIGGGTGLPVVLRGLRDLNANLTAVVTVADNGGSSGIIRNYMNVVPPGDIRNVLVSLSDLPKEELEIFQYRFQSNDSFFSGHAIGNLIIAALSEMRGGIFTAIQILSQMMQVDGHVYPACNIPLTLHAEFTDGSQAVGEAEIVKSGKQIARVWVKEINSDAEPYAVDDVIDAIMNAKVVVLGPGSLFTSILPNLMISNLGEALVKTKAQVVYICNLMTQKGETEHFTDAMHIEVLNKHLKHDFIDTILVNDGKIPERYLKHPTGDGYLETVPDDFQKLRDLGLKVIMDDFLDLRENGVYHNGNKIAKEIIDLSLSN
ncbi:gluconeogenesis factor YvcK family protein [Xylocopilactobacillus apicola]|uniref:Putative gluconeogenesis factor n=1 Tax=Xylocopilactobacillus apicola TaxID=2932184 RepID=A0AAU9D6P7_9LACO|nr:uridine diphosphate-N-acetylglucosamine-binding protein YvcK [Xylocopilactobacillus apicola]BDR57965.1 putative gluconeogenesis factor [Xylocopilactobacillus apicola]